MTLPTRAPPMKEIWTAMQTESAATKDSTANKKDKLEKIRQTNTINSTAGKEEHSSSKKDEAEKTKQKRRPKPQPLGGEVSEEDQLTMPTWQRERLEEQVPNRTIEQMAALNPNFLGTCCYLDMDMGQNMKEVQGTYLIVYTRPKDCSGITSDPCVQTFQPSFDRRIHLTYSLPTNISFSERETLIARGNHWGLATASISDHKFHIALYDADLFSSPSKVNARTAMIETSDLDPQDRLEQILLYQLPLDDTTVRFGFKVLGYEWDEEERKAWGFHFMEVDLYCTCPETGEREWQRIVAVKVPLPRRGIVSNLYVLKQELRVPEKGSFLREEARTLATIEKEEMEAGRRISINESAESSEDGGGSNGEDAGGYYSDDTLRGMGPLAG